MHKPLLLSLLFLPLLAQAQNWRPFRPGQVYGFSCSAYVPLHFATSNKGVFTVYSVPAEAEAQAPGDTIWPINQKIWDVNGSMCPSFGQYCPQHLSPLGSEVRVNGNQVTFYRYDSAGTRRTLLELDRTQAINTPYNAGRYTLTYQGVQHQSVTPNLQDSAAIFQIGNTTQQIIWSKTYGIIQLPTLLEYPQVYTGQISRLKMLDGVFGPAIPTPASVYAYQPGDTVGYHFTDEENITGFPNLFHETEERYVIRSRTVNPATNELTVNYDLFKLEVWYQSYHYQHPTTAFNTGPESGTWHFDLKSNFLTGGYDSTGYANNFNNGIYTEIGSENGIFLLDTLDGDTVLVPTHNRVVVDVSGPDIFKPGQGLVYSYTQSFTTQTRTLTCWPGHSCRGIPTGVKSTQQLSLQLKENPVETRLEVLSPTNLTLRLQDLQGHTLLQAQGTSLPTATLSPGLYLLKATDPQGRQATLRVLKL